MIPARLGSTRIKKKALRLLGDTPLIQYAIIAAKTVFFDEDIFINASESIFKQIADQNGIQFYKRPEELSQNDVTSNEFIYDFLINGPKCEYIIQLNITSPFINKQIIGQVLTSLHNGADVVQTTKYEYAEATWQGYPLNFSQKKGMIKSQDLVPVMLFTSGIMGYNVNTYLENYAETGVAIYGKNGNSIEALVIEGDAALDIDTEDDWCEAEARLAAHYNKVAPQYYNTDEEYVTNVHNILDKDGVKNKHMYDELKNEPYIIDIPKVIKNMPTDESWCKWLVNSKNNSANLICQLPGEGNRWHYHPDWNEWWYIIDGTWIYECEDNKWEVKKGDIVFIPAGLRHKITATGSKPAMRIAVSRWDVPHVYKK